jgi:hypothetical protein
LRTADEHVLARLDSVRMRAIVQLARLATGSSNNGVITRNAVSLFIGDGPGATLAFSASMPPRLKSLRHSRTVSSRTLNASAMRALVHPESVSRTARALSASPRSREPASAVKAMRCSSLAETGDLPLMPNLAQPKASTNRTAIRWSSRRSLLSHRSIWRLSIEAERSTATAAETNPRTISLWR